MFQREEHQAVFRVLQGLDGGLLERHLALFGGGTQLVLELGEYRISQDVDFLCSDAPAFAELRSLTRQGGPEALFHQQRLSGLNFPREVRADQYGIRFPLHATGVSIKFEVISEGRIDLSLGVRPAWSKAESAYGLSVRRDLRAALDAFLDHPAFQNRCFTGLAVAGPQEVLDGATLLLSDLEGSSPPDGTR